MPAASGTYLGYPSLVDALPPLVRRQRRYAKQIATVAQAVKDEKLVRADIDALLVIAGLHKGDVVTVGGYDVRHHERDGSSAINPDILTSLLVAEGIEPALVAEAIQASIETGASSLFATVTPTKGASVRASS